MRINYQMTEETYNAMLTQRQPLMLIGGSDSRQSEQLSANDKWKALGKALGFKWDTVEPIPGRGSRWFSAEEIK